MSYKEIFQRNTLFWDDEFQNSLKNKYIAVIGLGGVGGYALETLCRLGISNFLIADFDKISISNINRQIFALHSTLGLRKTAAAKQRLLDINPKINVEIYDDFITQNSLGEIFIKKPDFIIDAIDTVKYKIELLKYAHENKISVISSFGAGNRIDCTKLLISDISQIKPADSFTKNLLLKLKKYANIESGIWAVWSMEKSHNLKKIKTAEKILTKKNEAIEFTKITPASNSIVPAVSGILITNKILNILYEEYRKMT